MISYNKINKRINAKIIFLQTICHNFHIHTVHLDVIKVFFIHQLMGKWTVLKTILN